MRESRVRTETSWLIRSTRSARSGSPTGLAATASMSPMRSSTRERSSGSPVGRWASSAIRSCSAAISLAPAPGSLGATCFAASIAVDNWASSAEVVAEMRSASPRASSIALFRSSIFAPRSASAPAVASVRRSAVSIVSERSLSCDSSSSASTAESVRRSSSESVGSHVVMRRARSATACSSGSVVGSLRSTSCSADSTALRRAASTPSSGACRGAARPIAPRAPPLAPESAAPSWVCIHSLESDHCSASALASSNRVMVPASTSTCPSGLPVRDCSSAASSSWASVTYPCERRIAPIVRRSVPVETVAGWLMSRPIRRLEGVVGAAVGRGPWQARRKPQVRTRPGYRIVPRSSYSLVSGTPAGIARGGRSGRPNEVRSASVR